MFHRVKTKQNSYLSGRAGGGGGTTISISDKAKKLGLILGITFSMEHQINAVVKAMYFEIRNISRMKSIIVL